MGTESPLRLSPTANVFGKSGTPSSVGYRLLETDPSQQKTNLIQRIQKGLFERYLLLTNTISSGLFMIICDVIAQIIEHQRDWTNRIDLERIGRMFIVGALEGPLDHYFYQWMDAIMPVVTIQSVFMKIILDQLILTPVCLIVFFYSAGILEGKPLEQCNDEIQSKFITAYAVDWIVWPLAQFINFYWLHPKYRVTYDNIFELSYDTFLTYIQHQDHDVQLVKNVTNRM